MEYEILDNKDVQLIALPETPQSDPFYYYEITGTLSQGREKKLLIMAPHPEGVINSPLDIYLGHLNFNPEARLSLLIDTGINSTSGEGLTINGASDVASGSISAEFNGNISIVHSGIILGCVP